MSFGKILRKIFFPPPLYTVIAAAAGYGAAIAAAAFNIKIAAAQYFSYLASTYALIITITAFSRLGNFFNKIKNKLKAQPIVKKIRGTKLGERFFDDIHFRTELSLYCGLLINFLYILMKLFWGIYYRSVWFISLAVYYILLAAMRFILLRRRDSRTKVISAESEVRHYQMCGIALLIMNQALACIVFFMVYQNRGFDYPGSFIYAMAAYSFYSIITAVIGLVRFRNQGSPLLSAAKVINLVAAMVSVLALETAMLARFGDVDDLIFRKAMTQATGGTICTVEIVIAVFMIWRSSKLLKTLRKNEPQ